MAVQLSSQAAPESADARLAIASSYLFGVDLDEIALDVCALTILGWCLEAGQLETTTPAEAWELLRANLYHGDSASVVAVPEEPRQAVFDFLADRNADSDSSFGLTSLHSFDIVVANPPFSQNGQSETEGDSRRLAYAPFVRMLWRFTSEHGVGAIVLPLSIAYSDTNQIDSLRQEMKEVDGTWHLAFFDRTPDSLFGDDVKTRATIAFLDRTDVGREVLTTRLIRWNSRDRENLFSSVKYISVPSALRPGLFPKLGDAQDVQLYRALKARKGSLLQSGVRSCDILVMSSSARDSSNALLVAGTAYNFVSVRPVLGVTEDVDDIGNTWRAFLFDSPRARWGALALLSSRMIYWLWAVEQDGFHVNQGFVLGLPFSSLELEQLEPLGKELWSLMRGRPVRSVNKGRTTLSYSPVAASNTLDEIDSLLLQIIGQPTSLVPHLRAFQRDMLLAGRTHHERLSHHFIEFPMAAE